MSIVDHQKAEEIPWRPNYRVWSVAGMDQGVDCTLHYSTIEPGAGAPLHIHEVDELITVLEGQVEGRIGEDKATVLANQTMVIPKGVAHGFTASGEGTAVTLAFFPSATACRIQRTWRGNPRKRTGSSRPRPRA